MRWIADPKNTTVKRLFIDDNPVSQELSLFFPVLYVLCSSVYILSASSNVQYLVLRSNLIKDE